MTKYIAAVFAALVIATAAFAASAPTAPITLKAKNGNVTFNHSTHASLKCDACHPAVPQKQEPIGKDPAHGLCIDCHKTQAKGPVKCGECHKKA